jgi:hypothetical protein
MSANQHEKGSYGVGKKQGGNKSGSNWRENQI